MTMASLPAECRAVLAAPAPASEMAVTVGADGDAIAAAPDGGVPDVTIDAGAPPGAEGVRADPEGGHSSADSQEPVMSRRGGEP